jgi:deoxyribose-phosphate aldolase
VTLAQYIDHTLLKPEATRQQIEQLCVEAAQYHFASVCVNPYYVEEASHLLADSDVRVCTVVGFPLGVTTTATKVAETRDVVEKGANEIDMVLAIGALLDGNDGYVQQDIAAVVKAAEGRLVKVILETCLLNEEQIIRACQLVQQAGAHFVKTSTGFNKGGALVEHVRLMCNTVGEVLGVKASGGIRDRETAQQMVDAGATRIGTSHGVSLVQD